MRARRLPWLFASLAVALASSLPSSSLAEPPAASGGPAAAPELPPWEPFGNSDGIAVFRREVPGSDVIAFKGEGVIEASALTVASVMLDVDRAREWVAELVEAKRLRAPSPTQIVEWDHFHTPFPFRDRDFVYRSDVTVGRGGSSIVITMRSVDDPLAPRTTHVRGEVIRGAAEIVAEGAKRSRIAAEFHGDPKGSLPKWIVNWVQRDWPHDTIASLRRQVAKPDVAPSPALGEALRALGFHG